MSCVLSPFQFHKGTIKTKKSKKSVEKEANFNSIKVRLKHNKFINVKNRLLFQFHKGTIKTQMSYDDALTLSHISIP